MTLSPAGSRGVAVDEDAKPAAEYADNAPKICRHCRGWGVISTPYGGGVFGTEDCRHCAGTGEEMNL